MRNRKYLIGALVGVVGALAFSGIASAAPIGHSVTTKISPPKQNKKKFGGVSLLLGSASTYDSFATSQSSRQLTFRLDPNIKIVNGNLPACQLSQIQNVPNTAVRSGPCARSIVGTGTVQVNGGQLTGQIVVVGGGPKLFYGHIDIGNGALVIVTSATISGKTITITGIPNTPGSILTSFEATLFKKKTSSKKQDKRGKRTFYVMARCPKGKWRIGETTAWYSGEVLSGTATQKCKGTGGKK